MITPRTMTEKILARAAGLEQVEVGDVVVASIAVLTNPDWTPFIEGMREHGLRVWDPSRVVFCFDHMFQLEWMPYRAAVEHGKVRSFAREQGIPAANVYDIGRNGISHHIPVEQGYALPGTVCVGADTQSAMMGAANCFALPMLASVSSIILTGEVWMVVPEAVRVTFTGQLAAGMTGKDIVYRLIKDLNGKVNGQVLEITGPGVAEMSVDVRMAVANGAFQIGAMTIIFPADDVLLRYLDGRAREPFVPVEADVGAHYAAELTYDLSTLQTLVAGPHEITRVRPLDEVEGLAVDVAYIGSCSSGRISDLALAASVLKGKRIDPRVRLIVTPISADTAREATEQGIMQIFLDAGGMVTQPGCGGCEASNLSPLKLVEGERCISTSVEATRGRMGSKEAEVMLANAAVVAASALEGKIANPTQYLLETEVSHAA